MTANRVGTRGRSRRQPAAEPAHLEPEDPAGRPQRGLGGLRDRVADVRARAARRQHGHPGGAPPPISRTSASTTTSPCAARRGYAFGPTSGLSAEVASQIPLSAKVTDRAAAPVEWVVRRLPTVLTPRAARRGRDRPDLGDHVARSAPDGGGGLRAGGQAARAGRRVPARFPSSPSASSGPTGSWSTGPPRRSRARGPPLVQGANSRVRLMPGSYLVRAAAEGYEPDAAALRSHRRRDRADRHGAVDARADRHAVGPGRRSRGAARRGVLRPDGGLERVGPRLQRGPAARPGRGRGDGAGVRRRGADRGDRRPPDHVDRGGPGPRGGGVARRLHRPAGHDPLRHGEGHHPPRRACRCSTRSRRSCKTTPSSSACASKATPTAGAARKYNQEPVPAPRGSRPRPTSSSRGWPRRAWRRRASASRRPSIPRRAPRRGRRTAAWTSSSSSAGNDRRPNRGFTRTGRGRSGDRRAFDHRGVVGRSPSRSASRSSFVGEKPSRS